MLDKARFGFSPLGRTFSMGLDKTAQSYQEEDIMKLLKDIRDGLRDNVNRLDDNRPDRPDDNDNNRLDDNDDNRPDRPDNNNDNKPDRPNNNSMFLNNLNTNLNNIQKYW